MQLYGNDDEVVLERSLNRIVCKSCGEPYTLTSFKPPKNEGICDKCGSELVRRADDEETVVRKRLDVYQNETYPVLDFLGSLGIRTFSIDNNDPENASKMFAKLVLASL